MSLKAKATSGLFWSALERLGQLSCAFVVQLVLARILLPEQFGLIAMVTVFVTLSAAIVDSGFSRAIIQKQDLCDADISTAFYFNIAAGLTVAASLWALAPAISEFYAHSELSGIVRWLSLSLILGSFGGVHQALLTRSLAFRKIAQASVPATITSGIVGVGLAFCGYGVWALVSMTLVQQATRTWMLWHQSEWRPRAQFSWASFKAMFPYGSRLALSGILEKGFQNIYVLIIGKFFSPLEVGFFHRAKSLQDLPVTSLHSILNRVTFPLFSGLQNQPARLRMAFRKALELACLLGFSSMALIGALAEPMVVTLIGKKWLPSVPMLQLLCIVGAFYPLHAMNLNLLIALGRSDKFLKLELLKKAMIVVNVAITFRLGIIPMVYGMIATTMLALGLNTYYSWRYVGYGLMAQLKDISRIFAVSGCAFIAAGGAVRYLPLAPPSLLLCAGTVGVVVVLGGLRFLGGEVRGEIQSALSSVLPRRIARIVGIA